MQSPRTRCGWDTTSKTCRVCVLQIPRRRPRRGPRPQNGQNPKPPAPPVPRSLRGVCLSRRNLPGLRGVHVVLGETGNYNFLTTSFVVGIDLFTFFHLPFSAISYSLNINGIPCAIEKSELFMNCICRCGIVELPECPNCPIG